MLSNPRLIAALSEGGTPVLLTLTQAIGATLNFSTPPVLGWLNGSELRLDERVSLAVRQDRDDPVEGLVVIQDLEPSSLKVRVVVFAPPSPAILTADLAIVDPDGKLDDDLEHSLLLDFGGLRVGVFGQLPLDDADSIWWWTANGTAVLLKRVREGETGHLLVVDVEKRPQLSSGSKKTQKSHPTPPNRLAVFHSATVRTSTVEASGSASAVAALDPPRSILLDAWASYARIERAEREALLIRRREHPLQFEGVKQDGKRWRVDLRGNEEALTAWFGEANDSDRKERIGQPCKVDGCEGTVNLDQIRRTTADRRRVDAWISSRGSLPAQGRLTASEDLGAKIQDERQANALSLLLAGRAQNPRLFHLLAHPADGAEPSPPKPPYRPTIPLDDTQRRAVELILGCEDLVVVQGPPGTGKTRVIAEALRELARRQRREKEPMRVLVSSVQNEAVDNVIERIAGPELMVRLVYSKSKDEEVDRLRAQVAVKSRARVLEALSRRLEGNLIADRRRSLGRLRQEVEKMACAIGTCERDPEGRSALARSFAAIAEADSLLPEIYKYEARGLAEALLELPPPPAAAVDEPVHVGAPSTAAEVPRWWEQIEAHLDPSDRVRMAGPVRTVADALRRLEEQPDDLRSSRRRDRAWGELRELGFPSPPSITAAATVQRDPLYDKIETWIRGAATEVANEGAKLDREPDAIAQRFYEALDEDETMWRVLLRRYGSVVAATCSKAANARLPHEEPFDLAIIDEAGRATPLELLVPMVQARRIVLIGDDRQLPPSVERAFVHRVEKEAQISDFASTTLFSLLRAAVPTAARVRLCKQYRMHREIGNLVSALFYGPHDETLENGRPPWDDQTVLKPCFDLCEDRPVSWLHVQGSDPSNENNSNQTKVVVELVQHAYAASQPLFDAALSAKDDDRAKSLSIGVICAYKDQRKAVEKALPKEIQRDPRVKVATVDAVQGREYGLVVFVTSRADGRPGFMAAPNRVNVALSRAQRQLVVVGRHDKFGASRMAGMAQHLHALAGTLKQRGAVLSISTALGEHA